MDRFGRCCIRSDYFVGEAVKFMDMQAILNTAAAVAFSVAGWFGRQLWDAVASLRLDLHKIEKDLPVYYVRKDEFTDHMQRIEAKLDRIFEKLEGKADRPHG